ncbi:MAG: hypothetical protein LUO93_06555 [Methanomicrobiales archaeon]|nr:hypothetical protein [Methanomicrobiales archaeon]
MTEKEADPVERTGETGGGSVNRSTEERKEKARNEFMTGLRLIVLLLVFIAAVQFYFSIQGVIGMWVSYQFIPLVNAVYYLAVIIGGIWLLRGVLTNR